jgi:predicted HicB family RNase H-like nuclease
LVSSYMYGVQTMASRHRKIKQMTRLNLRIEQRLKEAAEMAAERDQRTLTSLILKLLAEHCEKVGTLKRRRSTVSSRF